MTKTEEKLQKAIEAVGQVLEHQKTIFINGQALLARLESARRTFMNRAQADCGDGTPFNIDRGWPALDILLNTQSVTDYIATEAIARALTGSPEYLEAAAILTPLIATVRKLEKAVLDETQAAAIEAEKFRNDVEAAKAAAIAEVEAKFATAS